MENSLNTVDGWIVPFNDTTRISRWYHNKPTSWTLLHVAANNRGWRQAKPTSFSNTWIGKVHKGRLVELLYGPFQVAIAIKNMGKRNYDRNNHLSCLSQYDPHIFRLLFASAKFWWTLHGSLCSFDQFAGSRGQCSDWTVSRISAIDLQTDHIASLSLDMNCSRTMHWDCFHHFIIKSTYGGAVQKSRWFNDYSNICFEQGLDLLVPP